MDKPRRIRIFISSPSDVRPERLIAERVVGKLAREFAHHFAVEAILWEREPLTADAHFQEGIVPPRQTDIVLVMLWSRLGVPLPEASYKGAISGQPVTGTEWEFEDALDARLSSVERLPDLLLYRKTAPVTVSIADRAAVADAQRQADLVERFMTRWTRGGDQKTFSAAFATFDTPLEFEESVEAHLRALLRRRLGSDEQAAAGEIRWHQGSPWRGLASFEPEDAPVFFGRARARNELRETLARRVAEGCAFVLVLGASGSGKSSLIKAGLLPDLQCPGMIGRTALVRAALARPSDGGGGSFAALAERIMAPGGLPELASPAIGCDVAALTRLLRAGEAALVLRQGLAAAARSARLVEGAEARLFILVDQFEELFSSQAIEPAERERFVAALDHLARSGLAWVVATMRSDFFDRLETMPSLARLSEGGRYLLIPPSPAELGQILRGPAHVAGLRFENDPGRGEGLDEVILTAAAGDAQALPLLSFVLEQVWRHRSAEGVLTHAAYQALGGLEGALGRYAEEVFGTLAPPMQAALPALLRAVVTAAQGARGQITTRAAALSQFPPGTAIRSLCDTLVERRLLIASGDSGGDRVRLAHEALLSHWPRARAQTEADREDLQRRARMEASMAAWEASGKRAELLLAAGLPLSEAESLVARRGEEIPPALAAFVAASRRHRRIRSQLMIGAAAVLLLTLSIGGVYLYQAASAVGAIEARRAASARGLAGTLIAYAGSAGEVVSDGEDGHGLYTGALLREIEKPHLSLTEAVLAAHENVRRSSGRAQTPQLATSLNGEVFLAAPPPAQRSFTFVVGANEYRKVAPLKNAVNDADGIASALERLGYRGTVLRNPDRATLAEAADRFIGAIAAARAAQEGQSGRRFAGRWGLQARAASMLQPASLSRPGAPQQSANTLAIIYFAGTGVEIAGRSLFAAVDAGEEDLRKGEGGWFDVSDFIRRVEKVASARVVILDYCRDDPFAGR